jgi:murein DD-endopeptidase MepM/ murein hydrolase activator NlpD
MRASGRPLLAVCSLLVACASGSIPEPAALEGRNCAWQVCVTASDSRFGRTYRMENREPVPVTVVLRFRALRNLRAPEGYTVEQIIPPRTTEFVRLSAIRRGGAMSADLRMSIDLGASSTVPDADFAYAVPFGGTTARVLSQGFGGLETHQGGMTYALDFTMPPGTPILAARDGVVLYTQDGFTEGGTDPRLVEQANVVVVAHRDGTMASYGHLAPGLAVAAGDSVSQGDVLGSSGGTGFAGQPHLHFHVGLRILGDPGRTIPIRMKDAHGREIDLVEGTLVQPGETVRGR